MKSMKLSQYLKVLLLLTLLNMVIFFVRNQVVGDKTFNGMWSNLWSGIVPFIIAAVLNVFNRQLNTFFFISGSLLWLLFYPNSPYMISDLIHPYQEAKDTATNNLIVYDTLVVFSLAMLSVFYGFISLKIMFNLFRKRFGTKTAHVIIFFSLALSCLGFYMGRILKSKIQMGNGYLYSSEIFTEPGYIFKTVWNALVPIQDNLPAYYMMILFGLVQYQLLIMMKDVGDFEGAEVVTKNEQASKLPKKEHAIKKDHIIQNEPI